MQRRKFIYQSSLGLGVLLPGLKNLPASSLSQGPYFATGIKIGEITPVSAIIWVRLTREAKPVGANAPTPYALYFDENTGRWENSTYFKEKYKQDRPNRQTKIVYPNGATVATLEGAVPGQSGEVRIAYKNSNQKKWLNTPWLSIREEADFSIQFTLSDLLPGTQYELTVEAKEKTDSPIANTVKGSFKTAFPANQSAPVHFMVTTCHEYNDQDDPEGGFRIYPQMLSLKPDFMVHTGDVLYYDQLAKDVPLAHWHWQRMFGLQNCKKFYRQVPCYFMKDDHDTWMNDCYPQSDNKFMGAFTFQQGVKIFKQQVPSGDKPYRTFRWGKDVQIWLVEGREYRTDNRMEDGPGKTIWGKEQMQWFRESFTASDATYKILISPTPIVGPDRPQKRDNHANSGFAFEGAVIRKFLSGFKNVFLICGDRHWQYVSQDKATGLMEFSCGPASNEHASGWKKEDVLPEHHYLNIVGGFLGVKVIMDNDKPVIAFTHYSVDGKKLYSKNYQQV